MSALYPLARRALFCLDAEKAHDLTINSLSRMPAGLVRATMNPGVPAKPVRVFGIDFPNPVGLAAGLDKNGQCIDAFAAMGFGFIEIGTVTPRAQPGNPRPRLFRLPEQQAIINRLGFNNHGLDALVRNVEAAQYDGVLGINIGKNLDTAVEQALDDYLLCLDRVYPLASYITVNISSPNTPGLRSLQQGDAFSALLAGIKERQQQLAGQYGRTVPLLVKIAPDLAPGEAAGIAEALVANEIDGVIATNTTLARDAVAGAVHAGEQGGLSGKPLQQRATAVVQELSDALNGRLPIIGLGGISSGADAKAKQAAGAALLQIYTAFIYQGPKLIRELVEAW